MILPSDYQGIINKNQTKPPVNPFEIAYNLEIKVYTTDNWSDDISGMIKKDKDLAGKSGYAIFINENHHSNRQRFTLAHEIGHFVLHQGLIGDGIQDDTLYRSKLSGAIESQANKFAADLLMPWNLVNEQVSSGVDNIGDLARIFKVSKSAMSIRIGVPYE